MADRAADLLEQAYGPESLSTSDVLAQYQPPSRWAGMFTEKPLPQLSTEPPRSSLHGLRGVDPLRDVPYLNGLIPALQAGTEKVMGSEALAPAMLLANFLGPKAPLPRVANPIKAYHGSPHDFDKFDLSKIGTGEGAQAYGPGLYFAENEGVARSYRDNLAGRKALEPYPWPSPSGEHFNQYDPQHLAGVYLKDGGGNVLDAMRDLGADAATSKGVDSKFYYAAKQAERLLREIPESQLQPAGKMYEVALHATPDQLLNWDKPFREQSEFAQTALTDALKAHANKQEDIDWHLNNWRSPEHPVPDLQQPIGLLTARHPEGPTGASKSLQDAGITGIKYLDQGSRGMRVGPSSPSNDIARQWLERAGGDQKQAMALLEGHLRNANLDVSSNQVMQALRDMRPPTSNYVVFDPRIIEILKKYGIAGPVAASILSQYAQDPQQ